jgi:hypothetical protein
MVKQQQNPAQARDELDGTLKAAESYLLSVEGLSDANVDAALTASSREDRWLWIDRLGSIFVVIAAVRTKIRNYEERDR